MHAACTASLRLAALGSHQNMWQMKSPGPSAMMKAKVCTSFPTPMNDRKRTRHSDRTSSVYIHTRDKYRHNVLFEPHQNKQDELQKIIIKLFVITLTSEISIVRVAEATFTVTGLQSALSLEASATSKAELSISMPK